MNKKEERLGRRVFQLMKMQEQLEECTIEIGEKKRENKKHMKEKEEE